MSAWYASGPEFDPHVQHILSLRLGHEKFSMAILPLLLIQEEQTVVSYWQNSVHYVLVNCLGGLPRNSMVRVTDRAQNDVKCVEGP